MFLISIYVISNKADAILSSGLRVHLKGAAIGNGWIDGRNQYPAYLEYAVRHGLVEEGSDVSIILCFLICLYL